MCDPPRFDSLSRDLEDALDVRTQHLKAQLKRIVLAPITVAEHELILPALPIVVGMQLLLAAIAYDVNNVPEKPIRQGLGLRRLKSAALRRS